MAIPEQVALVSFSNVNVADLLALPLTTVQQPALEIGQLAAERPQHQSAADTQKLLTQLVVCESSGGRRTGLFMQSFPTTIA